MQRSRRFRVHTAFAIIAGHRGSADAAEYYSDAALDPLDHAISARIHAHGGDFLGLMRQSSEIFGFLTVPLAPSFWLWNIVTLGTTAFCLRKSGLSWMVIFIGLSSPAEMHNFLCGQNGALTAGFFVAGLISFDRQLRFGGWMAGLLCIKPQIGLALPFISLHRR